MSQRKFLTVVAIFIASYMIAALGWWTFSLLKYSKTETLLEQKILKQERKICAEEIAAKFDMKFQQENKYFLSKKIKRNEFILLNDKILLFVTNNYNEFGIRSSFNNQNNIAH